MAKRVRLDMSPDDFSTLITALEMLESESANDEEITKAREIRCTFVEVLSDL